jgi:hypothetical protein
LKILPEQQKTTKTTDRIELGLTIKYSQSHLLVSWDLQSLKNGQGEYRASRPLINYVSVSWDLPSLKNGQGEYRASKDLPLNILRDIY